MNPDWRNRYELAIQASEQAGRLALDYFPDCPSPDFAARVEWKEDLSPVTVADRNAEAYLRETLLGAFPNDGFLGEESGTQPGTSGFRWVIDPVDGTRNFVRGIPIWGTLVGLECKGEQIAGVARVPALKQTFRALRGDGAFRDDKPIHVSNVKEMSESILFYSSLSWFIKAGCQDRFLNLVMQTQRQRGFGDFYGFVLVAQGSGEVMAEHGVHHWDIAALKAIVEEAGGRLTTWDDTEDIERPDVIASNGWVHSETLRILRGEHDR